MWRKLSLDKQIPSPEKIKDPMERRVKKEVKNKGTNDRKKPTT